MSERIHDEHGQVIWMDHPEKPLVRALTEKQFDLLDRICRTNGGGISLFSGERSVIRALMSRHFIQGKLNGPARIVHTREGMTEWRRLLAARQSGDDQ